MIEKTEGQEMILRESGHCSKDSDTVQKVSKKKLFLAALVAILIAALPLALYDFEDTYAATEDSKSTAVYDNLEFKLMTDGTVSIIGYVEGGMISYLDLPSKANLVFNKDNVERQYSVTSVGPDAFRDCISMETLTIPSSIKAIGANAFRGCIVLQSVTISDGVESLSDGIFYSCTSLKSVTIPSSTETVGSFAFYGCTSLGSLYIPSSVKSIGDNAFNSCTSLESLAIPSSVNTIGSNAFEGCTALRSLTMEEGPTALGNMVFLNCLSLKSVTIPSSVKTVGNELFLGCIDLETAEVLGGITEGDDMMFYGCVELKTVTLENLTRIGESMFNNCTSLRSVTIPSSVKSIGNNSFEGCTALRSLTIPSSVKSIGNNSFEGCTSLNEITVSVAEGSPIPDVLKNVMTEWSIGGQSFNTLFIDAESSVTLPAGVTGVTDMNGIKRIIFGQTTKNVDGIVFYDDTGKNIVAVPAGMCFTYSEDGKWRSSMLNVTIDNEHVETDVTMAVEGITANITITAKEGYRIVSGSLEVSVNGTELSSENYTYDPETGKITIPAEYVIGDISIAIAADPVDDGGDFPWLIVGAAVAVVAIIAVIGLLWFVRRP